MNLMEVWSIDGVMHTTYILLRWASILGVEMFSGTSDVQVVQLSVVDEVLHTAIKALNEDIRRIADERVGPASQL